MKKTITDLFESAVTGFLIVAANLVMSFVVYLLFLYLILPLLCDWIPSVNAFFQKRILQNEMAVYSAINGICSCIALIPTYILVYRFHIKRNKSFIQETSGKISPKDGLKYHAQHYMVTEIGTAVFVLIVTVVNALIVKSPLQMPFDIIFDTIGIAGGLIIALVCVLLAQLIGIYWTQNYWRAIYFIDD